MEGAAAKYLSAVDADAKCSNQHEIGGLVAAGFKEYLGAPLKGECNYFPCRMVYIEDSEERPLTVDDKVSWYDARSNNPNRSSEYRLYYKDNDVTKLLSKGDFFLIAKLKDGSLLMVFTPAGTEVEQQLKNLFGFESITDRFKSSTFKNTSLVLPIRLLLEELGIKISFSGGDDATLLEKMLVKFSGVFPTTREFSEFARLNNPMSPVDEPDLTLMEWMETEERMFRIYEKYFVTQTLKKGFGRSGTDVDSFINFSLSVQNRRKSRVGHAFENHLGYLFQENSLRFAKGSSKNTTENRSKPDFLFPGFNEYHRLDFDVNKLRMLGAKTTCKDRWRQVLAEADKIERKHLITLQPSITPFQTEEMRNQQLQLVVPYPIHGTYNTSQQKWLYSLKTFIDEIKTIQS